MEVIIAHEDEITLNTFLQLIVEEDGIGLYQSGIQIIKVSWESIDNARGMFGKSI